MSGKANINDHSCQKSSSNEKSYKINVSAPETETRAENGQQGPSTSGSDLNTKSDMADVQKDKNILSTEEHDEDPDTEDGHVSEQEPSEQSSSAPSVPNDTNASGGSHIEEEQGEGKTTQTVSGSMALDTRDSDCGDKESELKTNLPEESLEKLKMNTEMDETSETCQTDSKSTADEENIQTEDHTPDKDCEPRAKKVPHEADKPDHEDEVDRIKTEKADDGACPPEGRKSDPENKEKNDSDGRDETESATKNPQEGAEDKNNNPDNNLGTTGSEPAAGSKQRAGDGGKLKAGARSEKRETEKLFNSEENRGDDNLKPSDFVHPRLARVKRTWSDYDTEIYRTGYRGKVDDPNLTSNLDFYQGRIKCVPDGDYIDNIHEKWWDDYELLEIHHGYIQWLFPIRETGMNWLAQELQLYEAEAIRADETAMKRFKKSYEMMLNFYGIHLINTESGEVERAQNYAKRFQHLNYSMHNYLRITRILKCLGELGLEHFKAPFLRFMLHEAIIMGKLHRTLESCYNFWIGTVKDDQERQSILDYAKQLCFQVDEMEKAERANSGCTLD